MAESDREELPVPKGGVFDSSAVKTSIFFGVLLLIGLWIAVVDMSPDLGHLDVRVLSGSPQGQYHATVKGLAERAQRLGGTVHNEVSKGSVENVQRLARAAEGGCDVHFGLVQNGQSWPEGDDAGLQLIARLPKQESVFILGRGAGAITEWGQLQGKSVGIGPKGSGTERVARQILGMAEFAELGLKLETHPLEEQLQRLEKGTLHLGVFVIDEDARLVVDAIRRRGLELASLKYLDVIARKLEYLRVGRIGAGQYDPLRVLPPGDRQVLRVETLVVGNDCANDSETAALLGLLVRTFPDLVRHNRDTPNKSGLSEATVARKFFEEGGPDFFDAHLPWLVDLMPIQNWVWIFFAVSAISGILGYVHRFRLWRIDAARVRLEGYLPVIFAPDLTLKEMADSAVEPRHRSQAMRDYINQCRAGLEELRERVRRMSLSIAVPMSQEMAYRYQERLIDDTLTVLRDFYERATESAPGEVDPEDAPG